MNINVDELGREWGKWMRYKPNGWPRKNHIATLRMTLVGSGNSYARAAVISDRLDNHGQNSYDPVGRRGSLQLGASNWRIAASGTSAAVYGRLGRNPSGGYINNIRYHRQIIPIKRFMPNDALRFHRAYLVLSECHQAILWTHYVPPVKHERKLDLLRTHKNHYFSWLDTSQRAIARKISKLDADCSCKTINRPSRPKPDQRKGPLWPCRILASIHKLPIRHTHAPTDAQPICEDNVFRRPSGEIYAVLSNLEYRRLYRLGGVSSVLAERRASTDIYDYHHFNEWWPDEWQPPRHKTNPYYNTPEWLNARGLTLLDQCAQRWGKELCEAKEYPWVRRGKNDWYL